MSSWRISSHKFLKFYASLQNNSVDSVSKTVGTWTGESYVENAWGYMSADFDGTDDKIAYGDIYNGIKSVSFLVNPDTTTEQFMELASGIDIDVAGGTIGTTGWTAPTVYVDNKLSSTLIADVWQFVTVTSATAINANDVNLGVETTNFGDCSLSRVRFYSCELTWDEHIALRRATIR